MKSGEPLSVFLVCMNASRGHSTPGDHTALYRSATSRTVTRFPNTSGLPSSPSPFDAHAKRDSSVTAPRRANPEMTSNGLVFTTSSGGCSMAILSLIVVLMAPDNALPYISH